MTITIAIFTVATLGSFNLPPDAAIPLAVKGDGDAISPLPESLDRKLKGLTLGARYAPRRLKVG